MHFPQDVLLKMVLPCTKRIKDVYGVGLSDWRRGGQALRASMLTELETGKALQEFAPEAKLNSLLRLPGKVREFAVPETSQAMKCYNATVGDVARRLLRTKRSS